MYFTSSKYGKCNNNKCIGIGYNDYHYNDCDDGDEYMTGCGQLESSDNQTATECNTYNTTLGKLASTTGNIYGIYDINGGADEYFMENMSSTVGSYTYNQSLADGDGNNTYNYIGNEKNLDTYDISDNNLFSINGARLGDAIIS